MTTPDDRPVGDDRRMTTDDRDALDPNRRVTDAGDRTADLGDTDRTTDFRDGDSTTDGREADRTTGLGEDDRLTGAGDPTTRRDGDLREPGTDWSAEPTAGTTAGSTAGTTAGSTADGTTATEPLVAEDAAVDFRTRWEVIQQGFVDDPRNSVSEADKLVDDLLKRLSMTFEQQHQGLEKQWSDGEPSTEDLRAALQKYRAFFQRLLAL